MALTKHDKKVLQEAKKLKKQGYYVKADLPKKYGFEKPDPIGKDKLIPDITAKKTSSTKIIEVETPATLNEDKKQQETFRKSAAQKFETNFEIVVTD